jgi:hypothetical protein
VHSITDSNPVGYPDDISDCNTLGDPISSTNDSAIKHAYKRPDHFADCISHHTSHSCPKRRANDLPDTCPVINTHGEPHSAAHHPSSNSNPHGESVGIPNTRPNPHSNTGSDVGSNCSTNVSVRVEPMLERWDVHLWPRSDRWVWIGRRD